MMQMSENFLRHIKDEKFHCRLYIVLKVSTFAPFKEPGISQIILETPKNISDVKNMVKKLVLDG